MGIERTYSARCDICGGYTYSFLNKEFLKFYNFLLIKVSGRNKVLCPDCKGIFLEHLGHGIDPHDPANKKACKEAYLLTEKEVTEDRKRRRIRKAKCWK